MNHEEFFEMLQSAISGNHEDIEKLLEIYMPLINNNSYIHGKLDEDLNQYIIMHIVKNLSKFKI